MPKQLHGMGRRWPNESREHRIWIGIQYRCSNPNVTGYSRYGGRGIKVCARWRVFENFYADMGPCPSSKHQIERRDNNGNYEPGNCRWATAKEQARNRRDNRFLTYCGITRTFAEWSEVSGIGQRAISKRVALGWPVEKVLTLPVKQQNGGHHVV